MLNRKYNRGLAGKPHILTLVILLSPALILFTTFVIIPIFKAALFSLYKWNGLGPMADFRGAGNYNQFFSDPVVGKALTHNLIIAVVSLLAELPLAMILALIVSNTKFKGAVFFRTFFFLPYMLSEVITGVLWQFIYHPQYGLVRSFFQLFLPALKAPALMGSTSTVLGAILVVIVWKYFGLHMTIYIAGLQNIPKELIEAARIDGASKKRIFWSIILPQMRTAVQLSVFFSMIGSFQLFDLVWAMGKGGPVHAGETIVTYMYKIGLNRFNIGYGSTIAVSIFFLCLAFTILYQRVLVKEAE